MAIQQNISEVTIPKSLNIQTCPRCGYAFRPGELVCAACGVTATLAGKTQRLEKPDHLSDDKVWQRTTEPSFNKRIIFHIGTEQLVLPPARVITVGRVVPGKMAPHVDLSCFQAQDKGVSRQHIQISRDLLIYVADLASTNGTFLNGQRLFANSDCALNDGDELWLGQLMIKVRLE